MSEVRFGNVNVVTCLEDANKLHVQVLTLLGDWIGVAGKPITIHDMTASA
ncbi:hypothetical protein MF628_001949 [Paenibacillus polymyxa]|nr:hypothetical protein [Paenibacillus polymyxa]URJ47324.1 hypothetical protein MF628_001949 [Paenibacillus polymyxa]